MTQDLTVGAAGKHATLDADIDLSKTMLLGTSGGASQMRALIRLGGGEIVSKSVGDDLKGHPIVAIDPGKVILNIDGTATALVGPS
ncbi:hypothetical protein [Shimia ponticola]|uniref:hypothetical protein n=1 Tax=Shimia ponticola TaxID=2582893 RepID=UPI0011BF459A|nr:hypothetical protein [Shimia ponticola]